jgi:peptidoglycan/LPS O-acetylase OafA/YrhL
LVDAQRSDRLVAIQRLSALAAFAVAYEHLGAFACSIARNQHVPFAPPNAPGSRVALFFVVSGCVTVLSSRRLYRQSGARRQF